MIIWAQNEKKKISKNTNEKCSSLLCSATVLLIAEQTEFCWAIQAISLEFNVKLRANRGSGLMNRTFWQSASHMVVFL